MVRTTFTTCMVLCCGLALQAADDTTSLKSALEPQVSPSAQSIQGLSEAAATSVLKRTAKTLGKDDGDSKLEKAVHVNSSRIEDTSNLGTASSAANRLRSVRDSIFVPAAPANVNELGTLGRTRAEQVQPATPTDVESGETTSRRGNPTAPDTLQLELNAGDASPSDDSTKPRKVLPSVVKRRGIAAPQMAVPTIAIPPADLPELVEVQPANDESTGAGPTLAAPSPAEPESIRPNLGPLATTSDRPQAMKPLDITPFAQVAPDSDPVPQAASNPAGEPRVAALADSLAPISTPIKLDPQVPFSNINIQSQNVDLQPDGNASQPEIITMQPEGVNFQPENVNFRPEASQLRSRATPRAEPSATPRAEPRAPISRSVTGQQPAADAEDEQGKVLLSNRSPVLIVKTHGQQTIRVGRTATYYVTAANAGDLRAEDVVVTINVPNWAELTRNQATSGLVRIEPNASGDNVMKWSIRDLKPATQQRLKIDLIPRASRPIDLGVTWNFKSVSAMAQIEVQEAKLQLSVVGAADIQYGDTKLYTITVSNPGTGDAENVILTLLPINDGGGPAGTRELGDIKAGTRRTIEVELTARQAGELAVRASVTGDGGLQAEGEQKVRVRRPNLAIEASGPAQRYAGTEASYSIKIMNKGDATAQDIVAVAAMPMAAKYIKSSGGGIFDADRGQVRWSIGALRPGAFQVVELSTALMGAGSNRLEVRTVGANQLSAIGEVLTQVEAVSDLKLYVDDPPGVLPIGQEMTYEIRIINRGTRAAQNVDVVGYFSEGIEPVAIQGWKGDVEVGQVVLETIPRIAPGQEFSVKLIAVASRPGEHVFRTEVHAKDDSRTKLSNDEWTRFDGGEKSPALDGPTEQQAEQQAELPGAIDLDQLQR